MSIYKQVKDYLFRFLRRKDLVPRGLLELNRYFRLFGPIQFNIEIQEDGGIVAVSKNFRYGSIITRANQKEELDGQIKDAILTAFEIPSSYATEAGIRRTEEQVYAIA